MKPWNAWLYSIGFAGICLVGVAGCGGGDVPDASDSGQASADEGPTEPSLPPPEPAAPAVAAQPGGAPPAEAPAAKPDAAEPAEAASEAATAKPEANSATAEMLAIATGGNQPNAEAGAGADANAAPGPGGMGGPGGMMMAGRPGGPGGPAGAQQQGMSSMMMRPPGQPGGAGAPSASQMQMMARMGQGGNAGQPGGPANQGMASMMERAGRGMQGPGGAYGGPGGAGKAEAGDTNSPDGAVKAFLNALQDKDRDRLLEATARRAASDEGGKYREMFGRIIDSSISDSELGDLSSKLEGFKVSGENQVHSTGKLGVTVRKSSETGGWLQRTFTVRKEKKGWGVLDISSQMEFKGNGQRNVNRGAQGR